MMAAIDNLTELTQGGIFVVLVLKVVFDFLEKRESKKTGKNGQTQLFHRAHEDHMAGESKEIKTNVAEIHDALLAQPPRQSVVSTLAQVDHTMQDQVQRQKEAVHVLEEIRDVLRSHGSKLEEAKCTGFGAQKKG